jgi:hypothetical protein
VEAGTCRDDSLTAGQSRSWISQVMPDGGPGRRDHLSQEEIELISRTVRRAPEVMVKVLSRGGQDYAASQVVARGNGFPTFGSNVGTPRHGSSPKVHKVQRCDSMRAPTGAQKSERWGFQRCARSSVG